jgi:hypothetical protein
MVRTGRHTETITASAGCLYLHLFPCNYSTTSQPAIHKPQPANFLNATRQEHVIKMKRLQPRKLQLAKKMFCISTVVRHHVCISSSIA